MGESEKGRICPVRMELFLKDWNLSCGAGYPPMLQIIGTLPKGDRATLPFGDTFRINASKGYPEKASP